MADTASTGANGAQGGNAPSSGDDAASNDHPEGPNTEAEGGAGGSSPVGFAGDLAASEQDGIGAAEDPSLERIDEDVILSTVTQTESTKSYFLAQTLEDTKTVPVVSAKLPIDASSPHEGTPLGSAPFEGSPSEGMSSWNPSSEKDDGSSSGESAPIANAVSSASTVLGSFIHQGIVYAVESGGGSVSVMAVDPSKLPSDSLGAQTIALPAEVSFEGSAPYAVVRIADSAFSSLRMFEDEDRDAASDSREDVSEGDAAREPSFDAASEDEGSAALSNAGASVASSGESEDGAPSVITTVTIPSSITTIEDDAFAGADSLQYAIVSEDNQDYSSYDGCLYDGPMTSLLLIPEGRSGAVRIPSTAMTIPEDVSSHCASLASFIVEAGSAAFASEDGCLYSKDMSTLLRVPAGISEAVIVEGCSSVGAHALAGCSSLTDIRVLGRVSDVDESAFLLPGDKEARSGESMDLSSLRVSLAVDDEASRSVWERLGVGSFAHGDHPDVAGESASEGAIQNASVSDPDQDESRSMEFDTRLTRNSGSMTAYGNGGGFRVLHRQSGGDGVWSVYSELTNNFNSTATEMFVFTNTKDRSGYLHIEDVSGWKYNLSPKRTGYHFAGWSFSPTDTLLTSDGIYTSTTSLYARWYPSYTIYGNGGTVRVLRRDEGAGNWQLHTEGVDSFTVPCSAYALLNDGGCNLNIQDFPNYYVWDLRAVRDGYKFLGWGSSPGSISNVPAHSTHVSVLDGTNQSFYARWSRNTYSVTYNDNGGSFSGKTGSYNVDSNDFELPTNGNRAGYTFAGWDVTGASGAGVEGNGTTNVTVKKGTYGDLTATAKWVRNEYSIGYEENGGSFVGKTGSYNIETADLTLPTSGTRTGYTFAGWEVSGASGAGIANNGTTNVTVKKGTYGDLTAKAKWTLNAYRLSWDVPHGTHANRTDGFTVEDCPIAMGAAMPDEGYSFTGWSGEKLSGSPSSFTLDASFLEGKADGATLSFAASFSANPYTIRLHANDGTGEGGLGDAVEHAVVYDAAVADAKVPKRYGYAFSGYWTKNADGSKAELYFDEDGAYAKDAVWKGLSDVDVYACWTLMGDLEVPYPLLRASRSPSTGPQAKLAARMAPHPHTASSAPRCPRRCPWHRLPSRL